MWTCLVFISHFFQPTPLCEKCGITLCILKQYAGGGVFRRPPAQLIQPQAQQAGGAMIGHAEILPKRSELQERSQRRMRTTGGCPVPSGLFFGAVPEEGPLA